MKKEGKVPVSKVLDDMYSDKGMISLAARDYYYQNYASEAEKEEMDREERVQNVFAILFWVGFLTLLFAPFLMN